ncbi:hypothetical protein M5C90_28370 [Pseudomonas chlororaphis subsp. piscium]|nr:hypothetical protein M5C90_28370 [Pseudomonas chlororaphis subsp. piscium]
MTLATSLNESLSCAENVDFTFVVVDNSTKEKNEQVLASVSAMNFKTHYLKSDNVGYFPGFKKGTELLGSLLDFDCVAISNVDLTMRADFLNR